MRKKYDVIIIGSGVGGLVCGCYLAKAGLKVLLIEQHSQPGGYCTSFNRKGYRFDAGIHYLGGVQTRFFGTILHEIQIDQELRFNQFDPTDKIILPDYSTYIRSNPSQTVQEFKKSFPQESKHIDKFFTFLLQKNIFAIYHFCRNKSFKDILNHYFNSIPIKATLEILLSNIGLPASKFSAFSACVLYRDYLLDPGYYPEGGMQAFADVLTKRFKAWGGDIILNSRVTRILVTNNICRGVILDNNTDKQSTFVVSNADAKTTFHKLLSSVKTRESNKINRLAVSPSIFALYVGIKNLCKHTHETCNIWRFDTYNIEQCLTNLKLVLSRKKLPYLMCSFPAAHDFATNKTTIQFFLLAPFETENFWKKERTVLAEKIIQKAEETFPGLSQDIEVSNTATPWTFARYTSNQKGSAFGWASTKSQTETHVFPSKTSVTNLYLTGHWCTVGSGQGGIPKVAFSGRQTANQILLKIKHYSS